MSITFNRPGPAKRALERWADTYDMREAIDGHEFVVAVSLIDDAPATVQLIRSAGLTWRDFVSDLYADVVRTAFALVDFFPDFHAKTAAERWRLMARGTEVIVRERSRRDSCEVPALAAHGRFTPRDRAAAVSAIARVSRAVRIANQHAAAEHRALSAAARIAKEGRYERLQACAEVERTLRVLAEQKRRVSPPRVLRAVRSMPDVVGRFDPRGGNRESRPRQLDAQDAARSERRQAG